MNRIVTFQIAWLVAHLLVATPGFSQTDKIKEGLPPKGKPAESGWGFYAKWPEGWLGLHDKLVAQTKAGGVDVVFLGDSLTAMWEKDGKPVWDAKFVPLKAGCYGIGGDSTRQVIWRLENGELDGLTPKLIVLMIGTNNIYNDHNSGADPEIVEGVAKIVELIHQKTPAAKVLVLGVLPRQNQFFIDRTVALDRALSDYAAANKIAFVDFSPKFLGTDGQINPELFGPDQIHLSAKGYEVLGENLKPVVDAQLKP